MEEKQWEVLERRAGEGRRKSINEGKGRRSEEEKQKKEEDAEEDKLIRAIGGGA